MIFINSMFTFYLFQNISKFLFYLRFHILVSMFTFATL